MSQNYDYILDINLNLLPNFSTMNSFFNTRTYTIDSPGNSAILEVNKDLINSVLSYDYNKGRQPGVINFDSNSQNYVTLSPINSKFGYRMLEIIATKIFGNSEDLVLIDNGITLYETGNNSIISQIANNIQNNFNDSVIQNTVLNIYKNSNSFIISPGTWTFNFSNSTWQFPLFYTDTINFEDGTSAANFNGPNEGGSQIINGQINIPILLKFNGPSYLPILLLKAVNYSGSGTWNNESGYGNATKTEGTIAKNSSGNGIVLDGSTCWTFPPVALGNSSTVSVWYKSTGTPTGNCPCILANIQDVASEFNMSIGWLGQNGGPYSVGFYNGGFSRGTTFDLTQGEWVNIQGTWDGTNMSTYINGVLLGTTQPGGQASDSGLGYRIGRRWDGQDYMIGEIGEVRIYKYAISQAQVIADYQSSRGTFFPVVLLKGVNYSGSGAWLDESGYGRNATLEGGVIAKNAQGNGIVLNGSTSWTFPNVAVGNKWTVNVWYKNTGGTTNDAESCLITQNYNGTGPAINISWRSGGAFVGGTGLTLPGFYNNSTWYAGDPHEFVTNLWTNMQVTWDGTNMITYINGTAIGISTPGGTSVDNGLAYKIGTKWGATSYMVGEIGEVRIYKYAISEAQVTIDYNESLSSFNSLMVLFKAVNYSGTGSWNDESESEFVHNATLTTGTATKNIWNTGIVLDGSTTWTFPNPSLANAWTVNVWYKRTVAVSDIGIISPTSQTGGINCIVYDSGNAGFLDDQWRQQSVQVFTLNVWMNLQVTWDGTTLISYVNSQEMLRSTPGGTAPDGGNDYYIGRGFYVPDAVIGEIGEIRMYNKAISQAQVTTDYLSSFNTFHLAKVFLNAITYSGSGAWQDESGYGRNAIL